MDYAQLETAVLLLLEPLRNDGVKTLQGYGGEFSEDSFGQFPLNYPAGLVSVPGLRNEVAGGVDRETIDVVFAAAAKDLRGDDKARHGVYQVMTAARELLHRKMVPGFGVLLLESESLTGYSKALGLCVMQGNYKLRRQVAATN
jgi:hypothetical protein